MEILMLNGNLCILRYELSPGNLMGMLMGFTNMIQNYKKKTLLNESKNNLC